MAHLLTRTNLGRGGLAYLDVLCSRPIAYAYSDIHGSYSSIPTYSWDVEVITHETGHNLGSKHTHWCGWNTGSAGSCGAIDNCTTLETVTGCSTCGATYSNAAPVTSWKGTVMSYCHLVSRGISLANGFGPLPGNKIRTEVSAASCLSTVINAKVTAAPICTNDGGVTLTFAANNLGTAPYVYTWSNNKYTQNISGLSAPNTYSVTITDSNNCTASYAASVIRKPDPGDGIIPKMKMPVCCASTTETLGIPATVPQELTSCQSVYWLRTAAAPGTYAVAKAIFDTTQAANILPSSNEASITNGATGATLEVSPPKSCAAKQTFYYTPVVVELPRAAKTISNTAAGSTTITKFGTTIGRSVTLADQTAVPTACDLLDTPASANISITVSSYTGRTNNMRLVIQDGTGLVLFERFGTPGNGTYIVPASAINGPILQALKVSAFDYNCSSSACTSVTASLSAVRNVTYEAHQASINPACAIGTSVKVDFAPGGCTKLSVEPAKAGLSGAVLYPNPASASVTLQFTTTGAGNVQLKVVDMLGRTVHTGQSFLTAGQHRQVIDLRTLAKGVYFLNVSGEQSAAERLKLVVE
jgi:hypothetical protein